MSLRRCWFSFLFYIKRVLAKEKQKYVKKNSSFSLDPIKKTVGKKKQRVEVQLTIEVSFERV